MITEEELSIIKSIKDNLKAIERKPELVYFAIIDVVTNNHDMLSSIFKYALKYSYKDGYTKGLDEGYKNGKYDEIDREESAKWHEGWGHGYRTAMAEVAAGKKPVTFEEYLGGCDD